MRPYLFSFTSNLGDSLYLTNDNVAYQINEVTFLPVSIQCPEIIYDLKEVVGEATVTLPWQRAGFLRDSIINLSDCSTYISIDEIDSNGNVVSLFVGFVNAFKCLKGTLEVQCISFVENARDNFARIVISRFCIHRHYNASCGLDPVNFTDVGTIVAIDPKRIYIDVTSQRETEVFRFGFIENESIQRFIVHDAILNSSTHRLALLIAARPTWEVGQSINLTFGCDKKIATCKNVFNNFDHYLGFPWAPYESIRFTGLKSSEFSTSTRGGK